MEQTSMEPNSFRDPIAFFDAVVRFETRLWALLERALADEQLPGLGRIWAARAIRRRDGAGRVAELHQDLGITPGAASKLVDRLVRDGLVARAPHTIDRRAVVLSLTPAGDIALDRGLATITSTLTTALQHEAGPVTRVNDGLDLLLERLESMVSA